MIRFKQFYLTEKYDPWKEIDHHDKNAPSNIKHHIDGWIGISHGSKSEGGIMHSKGLEDNHHEVHKHGQAIRDALKKKHGNFITAYRGTAPHSGEKATGRGNTLHSYTTDKEVARRFAGAPSGPRQKVHSDTEINDHVDHLHKHGEVKYRDKTFKKNGDYVDIYDRHDNHVTDMHHSEVKKYFHDHNNYAKNFNKKHDAADKRVKTKAIHVDRVVWASDRANQKELIVRSNKAHNERTR